MTDNTKARENRLAELRHWFFQQLDREQRNRFFVAAGLVPNEGLADTLTAGQGFQAFGLFFEQALASPTEDEALERARTVMKRVSRELRDHADNISPRLKAYPADMMLREAARLDAVISRLHAPEPLPVKDEDSDKAKVAIAALAAMTQGDEVTEAMMDAAEEAYDAEPDALGAHRRGLARAYLAMRQAAKDGQA